MRNKYDYFSINNIIYIVLTLAMILSMFIFKHYIIGSIAGCLLIILIIYSIWNSYNKRHEWKKYFEDLSAKLDTATKNALVRLPFPLIMINSKGSILWYNQKISLIVEDQDILGKNIKEVTMAIDV
jgi:c-di-AMP phosphodiesterase-like protein